MSSRTVCGVKPHRSSPGSGWLVVVCAAVVLAGCGGSSDGATKASAGGGDAKSVVLIGANGIGPVRIGMTLDQVRRTGVLVSSERLNEEPCAVGVSATLGEGKSSVWGHAQFDQQDRVAIISSISKRVRTKDGIGIGSTIDDLDSAFGDVGTVSIDDSTIEVFGSEGVTVDFDESGRSDLSFTADPDTSKLDSVAMPKVPFCD